MASRNIAHITKNKVWLTTVDKVYSVDEEGNVDNESQVRVRKWKARIAEENGKEVDIWREEAGVNLKNTGIADSVMNYVYKFLTSPSPEEEVTIDEEEYEELKEKEEEVKEIKQEVQRLKEINRSAEQELQAYRRRVELMKENKENYRENLHRLRRSERLWFRQV